MTLCVPLLFISCQKDDLFEDYVNQEDFSKPSLRILNNQEISQKTSLSRELQNIDVPSRTTFSNEDEDADPYFNLQDYKVITELAKEITSEEHITYTFSLKNKDEGFSSPKLFNIVFIKPSEEEEFTSKLLTVYHFSEDQRNEIENKTDPTGKFFISFHQIDENNEIYPPLKARGKGKGDEEEDSGVWFDPADYQEFDPVDGGGFFGDVIEVIIVAPGAPPPDDWTPGGGLPDWGDDGGIPDVNPPIEGGGGGGFTSPVHDPDPEDDPCSELSEQFDDEDFKEKIEALENHLSGSNKDDFEMGYYERLEEDAQDPFVNLETNGQNELTLPNPPDPLMFGFLHTHTSSTVGIFSPLDFMIFWNMVMNDYVDNNETNGHNAYAVVMSPNGGNYILKFSGDDYVETNQQLPSDFDIDEIHNAYDDYFRDTSPEDLTENFFKFIDQEFGIAESLDIYKFEKELNTDGEETVILEKHKRNDDGIKEVPCN